MKRTVRRLLIVDDQEVITSLLGEALSRRGYEVATAMHGHEALACAERLELDAVMLDVMMPGMDGWQVLAALRRQKSTAGVPVIMMSAAADPRYPRLARESGAEYLDKPFSLSKAISVVEAVLPVASGDAIP